jgi:hypothetical protein
MRARHPDVEAAVSEKTGFLEESPGVRSMSRLVIAWSMALETVCVLALCWYLTHGKPEAAIIAAFGAAMVPIATKCAVALIKRNSGDDDTKPGGAA